MLKPAESPNVYSLILALLFSVSLLPCASAQTRGIPQPDKYAALLEKARRGELREDYPEPRVAQPLLRVFRGPAAAGAPAPNEIFGPASYREAVKTSFATAPVESFKSLEALFVPLPSDTQMTQTHPKLAPTKNTEPRSDLERRNVKVAAWIYWVVTEDDRDFHIILGSTPQLTTATVFMNSEVSGLPKANPKKSPFPQQRKTIRDILANHNNVSGLFNPPAAVYVTGSLFWDGEHRGARAVGADGLKPKKAWEIHPIKKLAER